MTHEPILLVPECLDPFLKTSEYGGKYIASFGWILSIVAWCCYIRRRVEVLAGVVIVEVAIVSTLLGFARLILLGVTDISTASG